MTQLSRDDTMKASEAGTLPRGGPIVIPQPKRFEGITEDDVLAIYPADGWAVVFNLSDGYAASRLLFWALMVDRHGHRFVDGFQEPEPMTGAEAFRFGVIDSDQFVCFAKATELPADLNDRQSLSDWAYKRGLGT